MLRIGKQAAGRTEQNLKKRSLKQRNAVLLAEGLPAGPQRRLACRRLACRPESAGCHPLAMQMGTISALQ
jgi:hypothetical protein